MLAFTCPVCLDDDYSDQGPPSTDDSVRPLDLQRVFEGYGGQPPRCRDGDPLSDVPQPLWTRGVSPTKLLASGCADYPSRSRRHG